MKVDSLGLSPKSLSLLWNSYSKGTVLALMLASSADVNALGYVSRDCPLAGTKESITWDHLRVKRWLYTQSYQYRLNGTGGGYWQTKTSGGWALTYHSYAGNFMSYLQNYYYAGVEGAHFYDNTTTRRTERRYSKVRGCNLMDWGINNW